ncbi:MAG: hypothetical protein QM736_22195, partial [Vicinamibacterales bacterium]
MKKPSSFALLLAPLVVALLGAACHKNSAPTEECCGDARVGVTEPAETPTLALLQDPADVEPFTVRDLDGASISSPICAARGAVRILSCFPINLSNT